MSLLIININHLKARVTINPHYITINNVLPINGMSTNIPPTFLRDMLTMFSIHGFDLQQVSLLLVEKTYCGLLGNLATTLV